MMPSTVISYAEWRALIEETIESQRLAVVEQAHACVGRLVRELVKWAQTLPADGFLAGDDDALEVDEGNLLRPSHLALLRAADPAAVLSSDSRLDGLLSWSHWKCLLPLSANGVDYFIRDKIKRVLSPTALQDRIDTGMKRTSSTKSVFSLSFSLWQSNIQQLQADRSGAAALRWLIRFSDASMEKLIFPPEDQQNLLKLVRIKQEELWRVLSSGFNRLCFQAGHSMMLGGKENADAYFAKLMTETGFPLSAVQLNFCKQWADEVWRFPLLAALETQVAQEYLALLLTLADWRKKLYMGFMAARWGWTLEEMAQAVAAPLHPRILAEKESLIQFEIDEGQITITGPSDAKSVGVYVEWELPRDDAYETSAVYRPTAPILQLFWPWMTEFTSLQCAFGVVVPICEALQLHRRAFSRIPFVHIQLLPAQSHARCV